MRRADRLFEIIQILRQAPGPMTAAMLADRLEVNARTVYRDIAALQGMRVPIDGAAGVGYLMRRGYDLPPLNFDENEVEAIVVGLGLLARTGDLALQEAAHRAMDKVSTGLPDRRRDPGMPKRLRVSDWGAAAPEKIDMQALRAALRDERALHLVYRDEKDAETERTGFRHFRTDRIEAMTVLEETFADRAGDLRAAWDAEFRLKHG